MSNSTPTKLPLGRRYALTSKLTLYPQYHFSWNAKTEWENHKPLPIWHSCPCNRPLKLLHGWQFPPAFDSVPTLWFALAKGNIENETRWATYRVASPARFLACHFGSLLLCEQAQVACQMVRNTSQSCSPGH